MGTQLKEILLEGPSGAAVLPVGVGMATVSCFCTSRKMM